MTRHTVLAGFALAAVVALGSFSSATDQPLRPTQAASAPNGFPATHSSRPLDEEAEHKSNRIGTGIAYIVAPRLWRSNSFRGAAA
jgi:hypothetical protein